MKKKIAIAFSDHHFANWKQFNEGNIRLHNAGYRSLIKIIKNANLSHIPILFAGDFIDHPKRVDNVVLEKITQALAKMTTNFYGINGNHDIYRQSSHKDPCPGYLDSLGNLSARVFCVDNNSVEVHTNDFIVHGIPYYHGDNGFLEALNERVAITNQHKEQKHILLIHRDLAGAKEPTGEILPKDKEQDKPMKELFKNFDLVLSGHIHLAQKIKALGKNVYMLGSTNQQRRSDMGTQCGYWEIWNIDGKLEMKFKELDTPEFRTYVDGEEPADDYNYWIKLPKDVVEDIINSDDTKNFDVSSDRQSMIDAYFKAKGLEDKRRKKLALQYLNL